MPRQPRLARALNVVLSWPSPPDVDALNGAVLLRDGAPVRAARTGDRARDPAYQSAHRRKPTRCCSRRNGERRARATRLPPEFLAATLLQESAYDVQALSSAGAIGIAQFMPETAAGDRRRSVRSVRGDRRSGGAAGCLRCRVSRRVRRSVCGRACGVQRRSGWPSSGIGGVPPYRETREYVALIFDRWARIVSYEVRRCVRAEVEAVPRRIDLRAGGRSMTRSRFPSRSRSQSLLAEAAADSTSSPADNLTFKAPAGWQASPGIMGFMQFWKAPGGTTKC